MFLDPVVGQAGQEVAEVDDPTIEVPDLDGVDGSCGKDEILSRYELVFYMIMF